MKDADRLHLKSDRTARRCPNKPEAFMIGVNAAALLRGIKQPLSDLRVQFGRNRVRTGLQVLLAPLASLCFDDVTGRVTVNQEVSRATFALLVALYWARPKSE